MQPGPTNSLTDVAGLRVGHHTAVGAGWLTGTTVVVAPRVGAVAGVDVRGGAPGTRDTDTLDPRNVVERVHAIVLTGGSAFGLASVAGVMDALEAEGTGFQVAEAVVPIVPAAVIFDLGRGGDVRNRPGPDFGRRAYENARDTVEQGCVGAGTGAVVGGLKGAVGTASAVLESGATVGALVVVNAAGSAVDPRSGELYGARFGFDGEFGLRTPTELPEPTGWRAQLATTIGVIATDLTLTKAQCAKVAGIGHDGLARAINPVHTMADGDTLFTLSTTARPAPDPVELWQLMAAAGDCVTRAVVHALLAATSAPGFRSYAEAFPTAIDSD
ncbi:P1 family peptidase [Fodinicola acaciae]|uniref:P1 family peptidase n=1 Tax=Fodinicola acaciae TaxID=2681555 RepID=UPI0013D34D9D|nr:P1 family peptidase [Fodinicola acaciae]